MKRNVLLMVAALAVASTVAYGADADREATDAIWNLLPPNAIELVDIEGDTLEVWVPQGTAALLNANRLLAHLVIRMLVEMWQEVSDGRDTFRVELVVDYDTREDTITFAIGETTPNGIRVVMAE